MDKRKIIYTGNVVDLGIETVTLPTGDSMELEVVRHPGGAAIVAIDGQQRVCMLRQFRHAAGGWLWELPAGKIDAPESPDNTAKRELREEAGLTAEHWQSLGSFLSTPGFCDERIYLYLATTLHTTDSEPHPHEVIEVHWMPFSEALDMCDRNEIEDGKTLLGLARAAGKAGIVAGQQETL
ncbi:ADP-ribose pyrophosphatase [Thiogranum longum]|uniref:GDP-mannose pyrophosphatase n=1 Tax=Thiogranum longum TaxID=1537524 RepID=A0A4R1HB46_9GAMM|nr:NUDIX hydrolase [Thiogranum longum]TCK19177.1 ADP-ribose pyrophosphatase [Thiogranum longum]